MRTWLVRTAVAMPVLAMVLVLGFFATGPSAATRVDRMLVNQVDAWEDADRRARTTAALRGLNPEWDLMRRMFLVLAVADRALVRPDEQDRWLALIDDVIAETLREEAVHGHGHFLLSYFGYGELRDPSRRSLFVDGEVALMMGARRMVRDTRWADEHRRRVTEMADQFARSPALLPESYPDEAWLFCNTNALVAIKMADVLDGSGHQALIESWTTRAATRLTTERGLLGSAFTWSGEPLDGPEGSSLWLVAVNLQVLDRDLADTQYVGARKELLHGMLGLAWASEWPAREPRAGDIDSGPIVPGFDASPASSGFALLAANAFDDRSSYQRLVRALRAADVVLALDDRFAEEIASNPMGEVVLLHGMTFGPLWDRVGR
ncbi:MAG: hypothetical protein AAF602_16760 [Myxococcota bacterium]